jgi:hypothetical protein
MPSNDIQKWSKHYSDKVKSLFKEIESGHFDIHGHDAKLVEIEQLISALLPRLKGAEEGKYNQFIIGAKRSEEIIQQIRDELNKLKGEEFELEHDLEKIKSDIDGVHKELSVILKLVQKEIVIMNTIDEISANSQIPRGKQATIVMEMHQKLSHVNEIIQADIHKVAKLTDKLLADLLEEEEINKQIEVELGKMLNMGEALGSMKVRANVQSKVVIQNQEEIKQLANHLHRIARAIHEQWGIEEHIISKLKYVNQGKIF